MPFVSAGLVAPSGKRWKAILLELTDDYHMGTQGMSRKVYRFHSRAKAMAGLEIHVRQQHPEVTEILKADSAQSVSPADRTAEERVIEGAERASQTEQQQLH
jgi:hypothetical protein